MYDQVFSKQFCAFRFLPASPESAGQDHAPSKRALTLQPSIGLICKRSAWHLAKSPPGKRLPASKMLSPSSSFHFYSLPAPCLHQLNGSFTVTCNLIPLVSAISKNRPPKHILTNYISEPKGQRHKESSEKFAKQQCKHENYSMRERRVTR